jgi:hypothetical protein
MMTRLAILLGIAACILGIWTMPTYAQEPPQPKCNERIKVIYPLANQFLEVPLLEGIDETGSRFEMWANLDTGTWTIITTTPGGPTCLVKAGNGFSILPLEPMGEPS